MSEFDHAMQGQNIAALQSMRHHQEGASEGPGGGLGLDSNLFWVFKSGLQDYSASVLGNIDKISQSLFSAIFPEQSLSIFSSGNPNITLFGFPTLIKSMEPGGGEGGPSSGMEDGMGDHAQHDPHSDYEHSLMDDHPHANNSVMDELGDHAHDFNHMQHQQTPEHDHHQEPPPIMPQAGRGSSHHLEGG